MDIFLLFSKKVSRDCVK